MKPGVVPEKDWNREIRDLIVHGVTDSTAPVDLLLDELIDGVLLLHTHMVNEVEWYVPKPDLIPMIELGKIFLESEKGVQKTKILRDYARSDEYFQLQAFRPKKAESRKLFVYDLPILGFVLSVLILLRKGKKISREFASLLRNLANSVLSSPFDDTRKKLEDKFDKLSQAYKLQGLSLEKARKEIARLKKVISKRNHNSAIRRISKRNRSRKKSKNS